MQDMKRMEFVLTTEQLRQVEEKKKKDLVYFSEETKLHVDTVM